MSIRTGHIVAFYLFDVSETIDLQRIPALIQSPTVPARLSPKPATPAYVQYEKPPLSFDGEAVGLGSIGTFKTRFRLFDYGVISIALSRPFCGSWGELLGEAQTLVENVELEQKAEALCRTMAERLRPALLDFRDVSLSEDYVVFTVNELEPNLSAEELLERHGAEIAAILRGERQRLSGQEEGAILRRRISYLADDLVVPTWNAAFVYDTPAGAQAAQEILEFANSQLLEFRYYDRLLDSQLASIYARLQHPRWHDSLFGGRSTQAARLVHALYIDVNELTDRTENAVKFIGDIYAVRLFALVADRLGLDRWKADVENKLDTLDGIYRFAVEQSSMSRGQFLELTIVLILVLELVLIFLGVMS